jgi:hypothetical protein
MSVKELFEVIPQLLKLFVPGFIFLITYKYFVESQNKDFNVTTIGSIVLSYVFQLLATLICKIFNGSDIICTVIAILLAVICAIIVVKLRLAEIYKKIATLIGRTTGSKNIWYDFFDRNKGNHIRFFTKYNNENVIVEGNVKYFEAYNDGTCNIVIDNYKIKYITCDNIYSSNSESATMIFNTKNIHGIEVHYGK